MSSIKPNRKPNAKTPVEPPKTLWGLLLLILRNNTGYSVKSAVMLGGFLLSAFWSVFLMYLVYIDYKDNGKINWTAISLTLPALAGLSYTFVYGKNSSEKYDRRFGDYYDMPYNNSYPKDNPNNPDPNDLGGEP